jgi:hypothetical protein
MIHLYTVKAVPFHETLCGVEKYCQTDYNDMNETTVCSDVNARKY